MWIHMGSGYVKTAPVPLRWFILFPTVGSANADDS